MNNTVFYQEKRTFLKYDKTHIIGYLNETAVDDHEETDEEGNVNVLKGYTYEGPETDGGTIMTCEDPTDYGEVANAIIRTKYSQSNELALHRHLVNQEEGWQDEWNEYDVWCEYAKSTAKGWFNIN